LLRQHEGAKLRPVVQNVNSIRFVVNDRVAPRDRDVVDANFGVVATAHFEASLAFRKGQHVDSARRVALQRQRLHNQVVRAVRLLHVDQFVDLLPHSEDVRVGMLAQLALERPPVQAVDVSGLLWLHFQIEPVLQALEVDEADGARALARHDARVVDRAIRPPAVLALATICRVTLIDCGAFWLQS